MTELYLAYDEKRTGGEPLGQGKWCDRADEYITWSLKACFLSKDDSPWFREVKEVDFEVKAGDEVYVVYVRYSTGDTFGCSHGAWYIVDVFNSYKEAIKSKKLIDSKKYIGYCPWVGYF